ncbi:peptidylprolyl isomerase [uncultured Oscillibacter sp.]|uniref:peptidylprolyl isomerase n=1 Tax=uncultured Oscillibacter sp. TaxID=876091 RepID=UPI0025D9A39B|nr:peptidylprolyl isomerase [uncultured Oscillibacter sp.]
MSASKENQTPQDLGGSGWGDPKTAREAQQRKAEKRSNILYGTIAVLFAVVAIVTLVWRSNILSRTLPAVTIDGQNYTAAEVNFYYQNVYQTFLGQNSSIVSYLGLNPNESLRGQIIDETTAGMMDVEAGTSWYDYFLDQALQQMATIQATLDAAEAEGFAYPAGVQAQYEDSVASLERAAAASGTSVDKYLQSNLGASMTEKAYNSQLLRMLQYSAYSSAYLDGLTFTDAELEAAYAEAPNTYDKASYEVVTVRGAAQSTTDADGNTVEPTEEETQAALDAAKATADSILSAYQAGGDLSELAETNEATYTQQTAGTYGGDAITEWVFDSARTAGDTAVLESGSNYCVTVFHDRFRETYSTIDVRHILFTPAAGTLTAEDEGYEAEQAQLKADALAQAEDILAQWQSGEATEASFAALAMEHSADGSKYDGGLYTGVYQGQMVETFNDWCFDSARRSGDTGIVETDYGAHVMYFVGEDLPFWQSQVANTLKNQAYSAWVAELAGKYTAEQHGFAMKFVG